MNAVVFDSYIFANISRERHMKKLFSILFIISIVNVVSGCASTPGNGDEQRAHAEKAQGELSSEVKK